MSWSHPQLSEKRLRELRSRIERAKIVLSNDDPSLRPSFLPKDDPELQRALAEAVE